MNRINVVRWLFSGFLCCAGCGGGGDGTGASGAGGADAGALPVCTKADTTGIMVTESDVYGGQPFALGYPPYAIDGCRLLYVVPAATLGASGELRLRDLESGMETVLEAAAAQPRRPAARGGWMAWEATDNGVTVVRASSGKEILTMKGPFDHAGEPRCTEDAVVFTGWLGLADTTDTDIFLFQPGSGVVTAVGKGPGQQRFPDVSPTHVAWSDFSEDPDGTFNNTSTDAADIVVLTREGLVMAARPNPGKQAFPMLGASDRLAYLDWGLVHPEPKFSEYELRVGDLAGGVGADVMVDHIVTQVPYVRPAALGKWLEWVVWPFGQNASLMRRPADLSAPAEAVPGLPAGAVYTPVASETITLVGAGAPGAPLTLTAFAR